MNTTDWINRLARLQAEHHHNLVRIALDAVPSPPSPPAFVTDLLRQHFEAVREVQRDVVVVIRP